MNWGVWAGGGSLLSVAPATTSEGTPPIGALMGQRPQGLHRHTHRQSSQNGARDVCLCAFVTCKFHFETNKTVGTSLVVQWLRLHAPNAGVPVGSLVRELDPTRMPQLRSPRAATKKVFMPQLKIPHAATKTQRSQIYK